MLFCSELLVRRVAGMPWNSTVNAPVRWRHGPITVPEATPSSTPGLSPLLIGIVVPRLCAGPPMMRIVGQLGMAIAPIAMFGYGMGSGDGAAGVMQTSGKAMSVPMSWQLANMGRLLNRSGSARRAS
ncbi:hypothetical protein D9M72_264800 [compost metagenome]